MTNKPLYPEVVSSPSFPEIEKEILQWWQDAEIFEKATDLRRQRGASEFVFYDGPPFANGLPHYGHLVTGFVKDIIPRFQSMKGNISEPRFGWDCHGLPAELHSEKELNLSGRQSILDYGMDRFNAHCENSVMQFTDDWEFYVSRQARWVDFKNSYKTMDQSFMESVLWAFKTLYEKGWIYESYRVVPYSWAVQSPLSNFETRLDNSYRMRQDPALTVSFELDRLECERIAPKLLAWTTTPWTLPSNMALAVNPNSDYVLLEKGNSLFVIALGGLERYAIELQGFVEKAVVKGASLVGRSYKPMFEFFEQKQGAFRVIAGDFVDSSDGTGVVHIAPAFGEDDLSVAIKSGIPIVDPVDAAGNFTEQVAPYAGMNVFDANKNIIKDLKILGCVVRHETHAHNYPHCWRTDKPLIYKAVKSWYIEVTAFRDRMVKLNKDIDWVPKHVKDGLFGRWLENARDWNVGRNRFWGAPIPVWRSDDPNYPRIDVYGSLDELERDFGIRPENLHRPYIDELVRPNPDDPTGKSMMRRVEDVLDCWFESGSMTFAQVHYPFENKEWFENHFPGDFVSEYVAQTRGWFYTMMVLSTALFDRAPFRQCICHGVVLDENRQKLSKRQKNYPDPTDVFDTYGADALRWYMVSSPLMSGGDLAMPKDGKAIGETVRQILLPLWNSFYFFTLYANLDGVKATEIRTTVSELDRYILSKTAMFVGDVENKLDALDIAGACALLQPFMGALNNWYIRRSRERFWKSDADEDKTNAYNTLYTVLVTVTRTLSPLLPFVSDYIHRSLCDGSSVHHQDWPDTSKFEIDQVLVHQMDLVREICSSAQSIRETKRLRNRLPLKLLRVAYPEHMPLEKFSGIISNEVNVKCVKFESDPTIYGNMLLAVDRKIGRRLGSKIKDVLSAAQSGDWKAQDGGDISIAGEILSSNEYELRFHAADGIDGASFAGWSGVVILDTQTNLALENEGKARDLIRLIQNARKQADLNVSDYIEIVVISNEALHRAFTDHSDMIAHETLATNLDFAIGVPNEVDSELVDGELVSIHINGDG